MDEKMERNRVGDEGGMRTSTNYDRDSELGGGAKQKVGGVASQKSRGVGKPLGKLSLKNKKKKWVTHEER